MSAVAPPLPAPAVDSEMPVADYFRAVAAAQPDAIALSTGTRSYTYAEIDRWSDAIATSVAACGVPAERPVALVTRDNVVLVPAALGILKAGHYMVTIDATDPDERSALILRESTAAVAVVDPGVSLTPSIRSMPVVTIPSLPAEADPPPRREANPWLIVSFTSGTTGRPKAIRTSQRGFVVRSLRLSDGRTSGERLNWTALPGYTRAVSNMFPVVLNGGTLCAFDARGSSIAAYAGFIVRERITSLSMPPSYFRRFMAAAPADLDLSSVRVLRLTADRVTIADIETFKARFPRTAKLQLGYAATEVGFVFRTTIDHDTILPGPMVPMGRRVPEADVWLLDEEGNEVGMGEPGELVVRSRNVFEGYWNDPALTEGRLTTDPETGLRTFRTGDLARRDEHGYYYFIGRSDARLKIHGRRIDPSEVETALIATSHVRDAVVVGKTDGRGETRLVAYVVARDGTRLDARALRAELRRSQPAWLVPARIHEIDAVPMTRAMKVDRAELTARAEPVEQWVDGADDDLERRLVEIWSRVIGAPVHVHDDFFEDHGGESVVAAHLATAVERDMETPLPMSLLLELSSVSKMAEYLRGSANADRLAVLVQPGGTGLPVFCVTGKDGSVIKFRTLAARLGNDRPFYGLTFHGFDTAAFPSSTSVEAACYAEAVRRIQPHGPYYLAGYSGGGRPALEIARLLQRRGEPVAFVGMLDSAALPQRPSLWRRMRNRVDMLRQLPRGRVQQFVLEAVTRPVAIFRRRVRKELAQRGLAFPAPVRAINAAHARMRKDYSAQPYEGLVDVFRARNGQGLLGTTPDLGWSKAGVSRLQFHDVAGDHVTMLTTEVESLGAAFSAALAAADQRAAAL